jgi:hypothetical protein
LFRFQRRTRYELEFLLLDISFCDNLVLAIERLTDWADKLINIEYIMQKQFTELKDTLLKIRIIKCGVRLCGHLSVLTEDMSNDWIVSAVVQDFSI